MNGIESPGGTYGIAMWQSNSPHWAIYMSQSGANRSFNNATAVVGYDFSSYSIRFRCYDDPTYGFIFENHNEELCMYINSGNKNVYMANNLTVAGKLSNTGGAKL